MRYLTGVVIVIAAGVACSRAPERTVAASPTGPTAVGAAVSRVAFKEGVSGKLDVLFPPRNEALQFRNELETAYQVGLGRSPSMSAVDKEGEVVWIQEYIRYRVNGCDHGTAVQRVADQIAGRPAGGVCGAPPEGLVQFPSRADVLTFRQGLETLYLTVVAGVAQPLARVPQPTFVDMEGAAIWIAEYLRYRTNECNHTEGSQKTLVQLSGAPPPATCFVPCSFALTPATVDMGWPAANSSFEIRPNPKACNWTAESDASWLTLPSSHSSGNNFTIIPFSVAQNLGASRTGRIRFAWSGGNAAFTVFQERNPFAGVFTLVDPFRSPESTTECWFRSAATPCNLTVGANLPGSNYVYSWYVSYFYGTQKIITSTAAAFTFTDQCGGTDSSAGGTPSDLSVSVTVTDDRGNTLTLHSGSGQQPPLLVRLFSC
jgi:hypothetical protein